MLGRPDNTNNTAGLFPSPIKSTDNSIHEDAHWLEEETENQHPNPLSSTISGFTLGTPPSSPTHILHNPSEMQSPSLHSSTTGSNLTGSASTSTASATTLINGKEVTIYHLNLNATDKMGVMFKPQAKRSKKSKRAHQAKTLEEVCEQAKEEAGSWPAIENGKIASALYNDRDFIAVNGSIVKLFRFVITPEKGLVCDTNEIGSVNHGLMTAYDSENDYTSEGNLPLCAAGEFGINAAGKVVYASNKTGHYRVPEETLADTVLPYLGQLLGASSAYVDNDNFYTSTWDSSINDTSPPEIVSQDSFDKKNSNYVNAISNATKKQAATSSSSSSQNTTSSSSLSSNSAHLVRSPLSPIHGNDSNNRNNRRVFNSAFKLLSNSSSLFGDLPQDTNPRSAEKKSKPNGSHGESIFGFDDEDTIGLITNSPMQPTSLSSSSILSSFGNGHTTTEDQSSSQHLGHNWGNISGIGLTSPHSPHHLSSPILGGRSSSLFNDSSASSSLGTDSLSMEVVSNGSNSDETESLDGSDQDNSWSPTKTLDFNF